MCSTKSTIKLVLTNFSRLMNPVGFPKSATIPAAPLLRHISSKILKLPLHFLTSNYQAVPPNRFGDSLVNGTSTTTDNHPMISQIGL